MEIEDNKLYNIEDVATAIGVDKWYLTSASQDGRLNTTKMGSNVFALGSELKKFFAGGAMPKRKVTRRKKSEEAPVAA